jgi:hypothetical protein
MEINLAAWERAYPHRALSPEDRAIADRTLDAMGEDLASVLDLVEQSGFYLDDHYQSVRYALRDPGRR